MRAPTVGINKPFLISPRILFDNVNKLSNLDQNSAFGDGRTVNLDNNQDGAGDCSDVSHSSTETELEYVANPVNPINPVKR